jgi:hypothetical protein
VGKEELSEQEEENKDEEEEDNDDDDGVSSTKSLFFNLSVAIIVIFSFSHIFFNLLFKSVN